MGLFATSHFRHFFVKHSTSDISFSARIICFGIADVDTNAKGVSDSIPYCILNVYCLIVSCTSYDARGEMGEMTSK